MVKGSLDYLSCECADEVTRGELKQCRADGIFSILVSSFSQFSLHLGCADFKC